MSAVAPCTPCCATPQSVNIPGIEGDPGTNGTDGLNAYTITTAQFQIPALNATVSIFVANTLWLVIGQQVIIGQGQGGALANPGPGLFQVTAIASANAFTGKFIDALTGGGTGSFIDSGAIVSPSGAPFTSPLPIASGGTGQSSAQTAANGFGARIRLLGKIIGANMNSAADQPITTMPAKYRITEILVTNASTSLTTAAGGFYTGAGKTGTTLVSAAQAYAALTAASKWIDVTLAGAGGPATDTGTATTIYFALTTPQGGAATADIYVFGEDLT